MSVVDPVVSHGSTIPVGIPSSASASSSSDSEPVINRHTLLAVLHEASVLMKEGSRNARDVAREAVRNTHMNAADLMESAAFKTLMGGVAAGAAGVVAGGMGAAGGYKGVMTVSNKNPNFKLQQNTTPDAPNYTRAPITQQRDQHTLNQYAQSTTTTAQARGEIISNIASIGQTVADHDAQTDQADAERERANATSQQGIVDNLSDRIQESGAATDKAVETSAELHRSAHETNNRIADS